MTHPQASYFVCMTPRSGSSLLCAALHATGQAGRPEEYYLASDADELLAHYGAATPAEAQATILAQGTTPNGYFGVKLSVGGGGLDQIMALLQGAATDLADQADGEARRYQPALLRAAFPNLRCLFLTRRNKVRQAVSWWKAVQTGQWVLREGDTAAPNTDLEYTFAAIDQLVQEAVLREAGWQAFFEATGIQPLTVVYEDLVAQFEPTMRAVLDALGLADVPAPPGVRSVRKQADALSEAWVQRYRAEKQQGWTNVGW